MEQCCNFIPPLAHNHGPSVHPFLPSPGQGRKVGGYKFASRTKHTRLRSDRAESEKMISGMQHFAKSSDRAAGDGEEERREGEGEKVLPVFFLEQKGEHCSGDDLGQGYK